MPTNDLSCSLVPETDLEVYRLNMPSHPYALFLMILLWGMATHYPISQGGM